MKKRDAKFETEEQPLPAAVKQTKSCCGKKSKAKD